MGGVISVTAISGRILIRPFRDGTPRAGDP